MKHLIATALLLAGLSSFAQTIDQSTPLLVADITVLQQMKVSESVADQIDNDDWKRSLSLDRKAEIATINAGYQLYRIKTKQGKRFRVVVPESVKKEDLAVLWKDVKVPVVDGSTIYIDCSCASSSTTDGACEFEAVETGESSFKKVCGGTCSEGCNTTVLVANPGEKDVTE